MSLLLSLFFLLMLHFPLSIFSDNVVVNEDDRQTLFKIKKQLGDPDQLKFWEQESFDFCTDYEGEFGGFAYTGCDHFGRISKLTMGGLHTSAPFPDAICDLTELQRFGIYQTPGLYGSIPSCVFTKLVKLTFFVVSGTSISGTVPDFYNITTLSIISLSNNQLSGTIPLFLSNLTNPITLDLSSNHLTGTLPPYLPPGSIFLSNNSLTGEIPKSYGLIDFNFFDVSNNNLSGDASFLFSKQKKAWGIRLAKNNFEFDLSYVEFSDNLYYLDISHNKIFGKVPDSLATAANLFSAIPLSRPNLSCNRLCGELPQGGNMHLFKAEDFADNACLCGSPLPPCNYSPPPPTYPPPF